MSGALNPYLYKRLYQLFGKVTYASKGERFSGVPTPGGMTNVTQAGEYYRVNCPYCRDTRGRLWISHKWGVPDEHGNAHWWMVWCYDDMHCMQHEANRKDLLTKVYKGLGREQRRALPIYDGEMELAELTEIAPPGDNILRLSELHPSHPAILYLQSRGFDPQHLEERWQIGYVNGYCEGYTPMTDRIYIPIHQNGELVFWQGRHVGEANWKYTPKYWGRRNVAKKKILYNWDVAKRFPWGILVEGVTDVWAMGDHAVAMLGDRFSEFHSDMVRRHWDVLVVLVDNMETYLASEDQFDALRRNNVRVVRVDLPDDQDPASADNDVAWDCIDRTCRQEGLDLLAVRA